MRYFAAAFMLLLAGCDRLASQCDEQIKAGLVAPSTYKRISSSRSDAYGGVVVRNEYEAVDGSGNPMRDTETCTFAN